MMHALTPAADLDVSVRARRLACVLDPALLLAAPHALLLAQRLARGVDLWVCPAFWRLLDASEFFARRPARLRAWLGLDAGHPEECVAAAILAWSRWRVSRDLSALGLYWVGGHQTESFLPENGPRDLPARFEALVEAWTRAADAQREDAPALPVVAGAVRRLPVSRAAGREPSGSGVSAAVEEDAPAAPAQGQEGVLESAALAVALQAPVLTLAAAEGAPALVRQWADSGLAGVAWSSLHAASAAAEQERWWNATIASGAAATVAAAYGIGVRLALAHVVAPSGQFLVPPEGEGGWGDDIALDGLWDDGPAASCTPRAAPAAPWWRDAQALWIGL
jgi:hypothetical protein